MSPSNEDSGGGGDTENWKACYNRGEDSKEVFDKIWRCSENDFKDYAGPFHAPNEWILIMKIVTKHQENMFDLLVFGEQPRELTIDPVKIFGNEMIGFEGCAFYTRVKPEMIKFIGNRFYTDWFDVEEALIDGTMQCRNKSSNESIPITKDKLIGFTEKLEQAISFRFEVGFEENGQPVIKVRAVNLAYNNMSAEWKRGNVPSIQVTSLEVKTLEMNPAIAQLGFDLPFYPVLFSPLELTMQVYEKYVVKVMPSILSQVVKHTDFSPESWKSVMTAKKLFKNTSRFPYSVASKKRTRDANEFLDPLTGTWKSSNLSDEEIKKASNEATNLMQHEASHNTKKAPTTSKGGYCNMLDAVEDFDNDDNRSISNFSTSSLQARKVLKDLDLNKPEGNNTFKVLEKTTTPNFNLRNTGTIPINGFNMPNNFYSMTAGEQWRSIVIHCKIRDSSMILDILGSPIPKESLLEIFPNAGRTNKVFEDDTRITMPLSQLRALEDSLSNERSEYDVRKTKRQMDQNNKRIKAPVEYAATQDNLETDVHPRLLHNFTLVDPVKVFQDMARNNVQPIPTDLYPLQHINGGGCITLKGWFEAANLGSTTISLKDFLLKNALRANSGARRVTSGQDNGTHFLESEIPLEEVTCLGDCMEGFCMLMLARSRACPADCSMEPINRFISAHVYFIGDTKHKPDGVNPGVFSAAFIDHVLKQNGLRYSTKMPFLVYTELHQTLDEFKMTIKGTRSNDNQRQDHKHNNKQNNKNTRSKGKDGNSTLTCFRFNNPKGNQCSKSDGECTGKHGAVYRHLCNFKFSGGNTCNKPHPVSQHGTNFKKED